MKKLISVILIFTLFSSTCFAETVQKPHTYKLIIAVGSLLTSFGALIKHNQLISSANSDRERAYKLFSLAKYYPNTPPDYVQHNMQHEADNLYYQAAYKQEQAGIATSIQIASIIASLWSAFSYAKEVDNYKKSKNLTLKPTLNKLELICKF